MTRIATLACAALLPVLAVAACTTGDAVREDSFAREARRCLAVNPGFTEAWACIRQRITREDIGAEDAGRARLKDFGDDLTSQLAGEALTSAEARARLAAALPTSP